MIIIQTPLRISFLGGGTDFDSYYWNNGGAVLSSAINKRIYVIVKERFDDLIYVNYSEKERVESVNELRHELVKEAMKMTGVSKGIEITTLADIPSQGTGLGSSSAVTVGLLQALHTYLGRVVNAEELAQQACQIEIDILGKPIGRQDQYISAYGNTRFITFNDNGIKVETVHLSLEGKRRLNNSLVLYYTGMTRQASSILAEQQKRVIQNGHILNNIKQLAFEARDALLASDFDSFGEIIHRGWEMKKQLANEISNSEIDEIYQTARRAGAIGGKVTGAGGGGFLLLYCPSARTESVRQALHGLRELPFRFQEDGSKVIFDYRGAE